MFLLTDLRAAFHFFRMLRRFRRYRRSATMTVEIHPAG